MVARVVRVFEKRRHLLNRRRLAVYYNVAAGIFRPHLGHWEAGIE